MRIRISGFGFLIWLVKKMDTNEDTKPQIFCLDFYATF